MVTRDVASKTPVSISLVNNHHPGELFGLDATTCESILLKIACELQSLKRFASWKLRLSFHIFSFVLVNIYLFVYSPQRYISSKALLPSRVTMRGSIPIASRHYPYPFLSYILYQSSIKA
ncbi:hypothetical protein YC2023_033876 [Brassica napus]